MSEYRSIQKKHDSIVIELTKYERNEARRNDLLLELAKIEARMIELIESEY